MYVNPIKQSLDIVSQVHIIKKTQTAVYFEMVKIIRLRAKTTLEICNALYQFYNK